MHRDAGWCEELGTSLVGVVRGGWPLGAHWDRSRLARAAARDGLAAGLKVKVKVSQYSCSSELLACMPVVPAGTGQYSVMCMQGGTETTVVVYRALRSAVPEGPTGAVPIP